MKSNFLSSQMVSHSFSPSSLPLHKAKWVQLNGKTLQVLKNSLTAAAARTRRIATRIGRMLRPTNIIIFFTNFTKAKNSYYFLTEHEILTRGRIVGTAIATSNTATAVRTRRIATRIGRMPWFRGCQLQHRLPLFLPFRLVQNQTKLSVVQMRLEAPSSVEGGPNITTGQQRVKSFT